VKRLFKGEAYRSTGYGIASVYLLLHVLVTLDVKRFEKATAMVTLSLENKKIFMSSVQIQ
jgi:hypothetical protein